MVPHGDGSTAAGGGTEEQSDYDDVDTICAWGAGSSTLGPTVSAVPQPLPAPADVNIPAGTTLTTRVDQRISVKTSRAGDTFAGELVDPLLASANSVLVTKGAQVGSVVDVACRCGHFKGRSLLELRLTSLTMIDHTCRPVKNRKSPLTSGLRGTTT
jgi:hypothetical protein